MTVISLVNFCLQRVSQHRESSPSTPSVRSHSKVVRLQRKNTFIDAFEGIILIVQLKKNVEHKTLRLAQKHQEKWVKKFKMNPENRAFQTLSYKTHEEKSKL